MYTLVLIRHGESVWNQENRFTGWTDVELTAKGLEEAAEAGRALAQGGYTFDIAYTSVLKRAIKTLWIILESLDLVWIPVIKDWRLNERHYGTLQGLDKAETAAKYGEEQVKIWRRSYDVLPASLPADDERAPAREAKYATISPSHLPLAESLKTTVDRFLPFWENTIAPDIQTGKKVIIAAHGNSLRALVKYLDNMTESEIIEYNIPTGIPLVYRLDQSLHPIEKFFLGDEERIRAAIDKVANQGKANPA